MLHVELRNRPLYNRALRQSPNEQGKVVVSLTIAPDGHVSACHLVYSDLGDRQLEQGGDCACHTAEFRRQERAAVHLPQLPDSFRATLIINRKVQTWDF